MFLFKKVTIDNFRSIGHIELDLDNRGVVLVEGQNNTNSTFFSNGSGKSSLLSAISWALYDTTPDGNKADEIVNREVGKNTSVVLEVEVDGAPYTIERYRKHKTYKNKVRLLQEENELTLSTVALTNKKILELFGIDYNTYLNSIMYGQGDVEIFAKATDKGKKEILENVANIGIYQEAQAQAKESLAQAKLEVSRIESEIQITNVKLGEVYTLEQSEAQNYKQTAELIKHQQSEVARLEALQTQLQEQIAQQLEQNNEAMRTLETQLADLEEPSTPEELVEDYNSFQAQLAQLDSVYQVKVSEIKTVQKNLDSLGTSTNCYACGTLLDTSHRELERVKLQKELEGMSNSLTPVETTLPALRAKLQEKKEALDTIYITINNTNNQRLSIQNQQTELKRQRYEIENQTGNIEQQLASKKEQLINLESLPKPKKRTKERDALMEQVEALGTELAQATTDVEEYEVVVNQIYSNKGVRSHVLDLTTPFLNERANHYLTALSGSDIQIDLSTQKENKDGTMSDSFELRVENGSGGNDYKSNSAGERKRIDLAIALAIQDLIFSKSNLVTNLAVYDECFDGLDSVGCENVIEILKEKQKTIGTIFVITHSETLKPLFENVITVEKVNGITSLLTTGGKNES